MDTWEPQKQRFVHPVCAVKRGETSSGSERVSHTGATGLRLQEASSINRSLAALSDVIKVHMLLYTAGGRYVHFSGNYFLSRKGIQGRRKWVP